MDNEEYNTPNSRKGVNAWLKKMHGITKRGDEPTISVCEIALMHVGCAEVSILYSIFQVYLCIYSVYMLARKAGFEAVDCIGGGHQVKGRCGGLES